MAMMVWTSKMKKSIFGDLKGIFCPSFQKTGKEFPSEVMDKYQVLLLNKTNQLCRRVFECCRLKLSESKTKRLNEVSDTIDNAIDILDNIEKG